MIRIYIWNPVGIVTALEAGVPPDFGHAAMEIVSDNNAGVYISYWPEMDTPMGQFMQLVKARAKRHPESYAEEIDPEAGYMEREASHIGEIAGIREDLIKVLWQQLKSSEYDFFKWNCSSVCKFLILSAMDRSFNDQMLAAAVCTPEDLLTVDSAEDLAVRLRILATSPFIDCRPDDLHRMIDAYNRAYAEASAPHERVKDAVTAD